MYIIKYHICKHFTSIHKISSKVTFSNFSADLDFRTPILLGSSPIFTPKIGEVLPRFLFVFNGWKTNRKRIESTICSK